MIVDNSRQNLNNILILTEKKYIEKQIKKALPNVHCMSIGGHAYTSDEEKYISLSQVDKEFESNICINYKDEKGIEEPVRILGYTTIKENCLKISEFLLLNKNNISCIINACDYDKNGDYLFKYVTEEIMNLTDSQYSFKRMKLFDLTEESIVASFKDILNSDDNLVKASVGSGMSFSNKLSMMETNQDGNNYNDMER